MSADIYLQGSLGYYMKLTLKIMSCCTVNLTIPILLTVIWQILLCSRWLNVPTLTWKTQLASILSISCNVQYLAQQHSQNRLQWSMLQHRTFRRFRRANTVSWEGGPHDNVIKQMKAEVAWKQKGFERCGHCAVCDPNVSLRSKNDEKRTSYATNRKMNVSRIVLSEKLWGQES